MFVITERKFEIKPKNKFGLRKAFFWCTLIQAVEVKWLGFFLQNVHLIAKYLPPFHFTTSWVKGGLLRVKKNNSPFCSCYQLTTLLSTIIYILNEIEPVSLILVSFLNRWTAPWHQPRTCQVITLFTTYLSGTTIVNTFYHIKAKISKSGKSPWQTVLIESDLLNL